MSVLSINVGETGLVYTVPSSRIGSCACAAGVVTAAPAGNAIRITGTSPGTDTVTFDVDGTTTAFDVTVTPHGDQDNGGG